MWVLGRNNKSALLVAISVLIIAAMTATGWGGEFSSPTGVNALAQPALPQSFFDPNFLDYSKLGTDFSRNGQTFAPPSRAPAGEKGRINFDLKTDYEVDIEKFLPADTFPQRGLGNLQNRNLQKKNLPLMGLSISKPLN